MDIPSLEQAKNMIAEAELMNPGPWVAHCYSAAENARLIAQKCAHLEPDAAYVMGLLHDIGRRGGVTQILHLFDGYDYLSARGFGDAAKICLTHSFPVADINTFFGEFDCTPAQIEFLKSYLGSVEYTDYDLLIQLCDAISMPQGAVLLEKRFVDVATRHGLPGFTLKKWQSYFNLKAYFDQKSGTNIYGFLPDIIQNTFN